MCGKEGELQDSHVSKNLSLIGSRMKNRYFNSTHYTIFVFGRKRLSILTPQTADCCRERQNLRLFLHISAGCKNTYDIINLSLLLVCKRKSVVITLFITVKWFSFFYQMYENIYFLMIQLIFCIKQVKMDDEFETCLAKFKIQLYLFALYLILLY